MTSQLLHVHPQKSLKVVQRKTRNFRGMGFLKGKQLGANKLKYQIMTKNLQRQDNET